MATNIEGVTPTRVYGANSIGFSAGVAAALAITVLTALARLTGLTELNFEMLFGSLFTGERGAGTWLLGFLVHLILGGTFGVIYGMGFRFVKKAGWAVGMSFGVVHWLLAGLFLGGLVRAAGTFALGYGGSGFATFLLAHLIFGAIVGEVCRPGYRARLSGTRESIYRRAA